MPETPSPPPSPASRPRGVRAVQHRRPDGSTVTYWYCRLTGARLPDISDPGFAAAVARARQRPAPAHQAGTLGEMLADWRRSPAYRAAAASTQSSRDRYLAAIEAPEWAARRVVTLDMEGLRQLRADLLKLRDAIAGQNGVGAATVFGAHVQSLFTWAVEHGRLAWSPMTKLPALGGGRIPSWTEAEAQHAMKAWPEHLRRVVVLAYWIGQRKGDLVSLRWDTHHDEARGLIILQPEKTRRRREARGLPALRIPIPSPLRWELRKWRAQAPEATHILLSPQGKPWTKMALSHALRKQLRAEGWDTKKGLHGLRKRSAEVLAEAGASASQIGKARGWDTLSMVDLYTSGADQESMARGAVARVEKRLSKVGKSRRKAAE